jgi:hypothetical protein
MSTLPGLKIKRFKVLNVDYLGFSAYRLRLEVAEASNMDPRVFVYRRDPVDPYTNDQLDTFFTVASPVDMEEYPPENPDPQKAYPFLRKSFVELDFRATETALDAERIILSELNVLVVAMTRLAQLEQIEEFWIGEPAPGDSLSVS